jgi:hypothetical protein
MQASTFRTIIGNFIATVANIASALGKFIAIVENYAAIVKKLCCSGRQIHNSNMKLLNIIRRTSEQPSNFRTAVGNFTTMVANIASTLGNFCAIVGNYTSTVGNFATLVDNFTTVSNLVSAVRNSIPLRSASHALLSHQTWSDGSRP